MRVWTSAIGQRLDSAENTRTMLLSDALVRRGHEVTLWTSAYDHIRKQWRTEWQTHGEAGYSMPNGVKVRFMKGCGYKSNVSVSRLADHMLAARDLRRQAHYLPPPDAIVASLPDHVTAEEFVKIGRSTDATVFVDVRDKWPDIFIDYAPNAALKALVTLGLAWESRRAARALAGADALISVMDSMMDWGLAKAGRASLSDDKIFHLTTTPRNFGIERPAIELASAVQEAFDGSVGKTVLTFVGTFNRTQHPALVLDAIDNLTQRGLLSSQWIFWIGGDGVDADDVRRRAASMPSVKLLGWLDTPTMLEVLARSDVGLLPMNFATPVFNNKAFAYMASGLPILNGATGDLANLIEQHRIGINLQAGDPQALADAIVEITKDPIELASYQERTRKLFDETFDREANYGNYVAHIEKVTAARAAARR